MIPHRTRLQVTYSITDYMNRALRLPLPADTLRPLLEDSYEPGESASLQFQIAGGDVVTTGRITVEAREGDRCTFLLGLPASDEGERDGAVWERLTLRGLWHRGELIDVSLECPGCARRETVLYLTRLPTPIRCEVCVALAHLPELLRQSGIEVDPDAVRAARIDRQGDTVRVTIEELTRDLDKSGDRPGGAKVTSELCVISGKQRAYSRTGD